MLGYNASENGRQMATQLNTTKNPEQVARSLVDVLADRKAEDVVLLDLREVSVIADFFVICTGSSERQINALTRALVERADEMGAHSRRTEGSSEGGWVLLDFEDVIAHVFSPDQRSFYRLEELWRGARPLLVIQ